MRVIDDFMTIYEKEYDFFDNYSKIVAGRIEERLFKMGIKAVVTHRPKNAQSLREKIEKNNRSRKYVSVTEIYDDIKDLSGVRVSLYFPLPEYIIDEILNDAFVVLEKHQPVMEKQNTIYKRRYPGYHAVHYHVKTVDENGTGRYVNSIAEIQVATTLMHAWAEIDHDLVYKPSYGDPSIKELAMLDEVNGLILSAEMALKSLQHAMAERTIKNGFPSDKYELANLLLVSIHKDHFKKCRLGNVYLLQYYLETLGKTAFNQLLVLFKEINPRSPDSISDQLLYMLLVKNYHPVKKTLRAYFKKLHFFDKEITLADKFIADWVTIERRMMKIMKSQEPKRDQYTLYPFKILTQKKILTSAETAVLENLYLVKKDVLHGRKVISSTWLANCIIILKSFSTRLAKRVIKPGKNGKKAN